MRLTLPLLIGLGSILGPALALAQTPTNMLGSCSGTVSNTMIGGTVGLVLGGVLGNRLGASAGAHAALKLAG